MSYIINQYTGLPDSVGTSGGSGDVTGPASAVGDTVALFNGITGKIIKDSGLTLSGTNTGDQPLVNSSGIITGGALSIGTGGAGVATSFTISAGTGQVVDSTVSPPTTTPVSWSAKTDVAVTNILTQLVTFVAIDGGGNVIQSATDFTPAQQRLYIVIGVAVHSNQTTVNAVNQTQAVAYAPGAQVNDLMFGLGLFNVSGNTFSPNGANLKINKSAGSLFRRGANYTSLTDNPHIISTGALTQASLRMQNQTGAGSASTTDIDVANYDLAGVTTAISPATRFSVLRVFLFQSNLIAVQRGQTTYQSLAEAKAAIQTETFVTNDILAANGLLRGFIVAQANATDLSDAGKAFFIEAGKFGGSSGVGGLSVSTMQNAYDNSSTPEILTDATRLGLTIRRGSGADSDVILEGQTGAGATTFSVTGAGVVSGSNLSGTNTGDQTSIVGITGTIAQFNTACSDADFATGGGTATGTNTGDQTTTAGLANSTDKNLVTDAQLTVIGNTSGTNTGDQTTIAGIAGTKAEFDTACTDGNFLYVGDVTAYTDEEAQDAVGGMVNSTLTYVDGTPSLGINLGNANTWTVDQSVPTETYGVGWSASAEVPTKGDLYTKIQSMGGGVSLSDVYPVGSVYISVVSTNPGTLFGIGTWAAIATGRTLVGIDTGDTDFDTVEETGGAKTVASAGTNANESAHTHTYTDVPNHVHVLNAFPTATGGSTGFTRDTSMSGTPADTSLSTNNPTGGVATGTTNAGSAHTHTFTGSATSVVQPYFVVYMWKRTA